MRLRFALLSATVLALPVVAQAQPVTGLYVAGGVGGNYIQREHIRASSALDTPNLHGNFKIGGTGVASVGYGLGNGLRIELEGSYRYNKLRSINTTNGPGVRSGFQEQYGAMGNVLYDFDVGIPFVFPYIGGGAGYQFVHWKNIGTRADDGSFDINATDTTGNFAYQGIAGVAYPVAPVPGLSATLEYRYMGVLGYQGFTGENLTPASSGVGLHQARGNIDANHVNNHSVLIGLRYAFGAPPPPPPPAPPAQIAPPVEAARTYLVFFDWDKSALTARARQIISEAAQASTHVQTTRIEVNGYTDLSGTAKYNQGLSVRRADAVKAELIRDGVSSGEIMTQGFGESHPLVPTAQGVREPQNRRVEIILK